MCDDSDGDEVERQSIHHVEQSEQDDLCLSTRVTNNGVSREPVQAELAREGRDGRR